MTKAAATQVQVTKDKVTFFSLISPEGVGGLSFNPLLPPLVFPSHDSRQHGQNPAEKCETHTDNERPGQMVRERGKYIITFFGARLL